MKEIIVYALAHMAAEFASFVVGYGVYYLLAQTLSIATPVAFVVAATITASLWFASFFFISFSNKK